MSGQVPPADGKLGGMASTAKEKASGLKGKALEKAVEAKTIGAEASQVTANLDQ